MNIGEALNTALEYENKVYEVYNDSVGKLESATAKKIFAVMAREEQDHIGYLKAKLAEWRQSGEAIASDIGTAVPDMETLRKNVEKLKETVAKEDLSNEIEIFKKALELETRTSEFYKSLASELSSDDKAFFERFVEIEEGHKMIIQAEIDCAKQSGFWFDFMEFGLEEA